MILGLAKSQSRESGSPCATRGVVEVRADVVGEAILAVNVSKAHPRATTSTPTVARVTVRIQ